MISFIIPAYNEENRIFRSLVRLSRYLNKVIESYEIICVVDGVDRTVKIVEDFILKDSRIRILKFSKRLGKGGAIIEGIKNAKGKKIMMLDADVSISLKSIPRIIELLDDYCIVVGSRYVKGSKNICPIYRKILGRICNSLESKIFNLGINDVQVGFKAFRTEVGHDLVKKSTIKGFAWDLELLCNARKFNYSITEFPIEWFYEKNSKTKVLNVAGEIIVSILKLKLKYL
jgi:dolichyl-phosphate beta-glucosyltransferase